MSKNGASNVTLPKFNMVHLKMIVSLKGISLFQGLIFRWTISNFRGLWFTSLVGALLSKDPASSNSCKGAETPSKITGTSVFPWHFSDVSTFAEKGVTANRTANFQQFWIDVWLNSHFLRWFASSSNWNDHYKWRFQVPFKVPAGRRGPTKLGRNLKQKWRQTDHVYDQ